MKVITLPIILSYAEWNSTRHSSMSARGVGGAADRNGLSARKTNGAAMLSEVDTTAVAVLLLVRFVAKVREVVGGLLVRQEVEEP